MMLVGISPKQRKKCYINSIVVSNYKIKMSHRRILIVRSTDRYEILNLTSIGHFRTFNERMEHNSLTILRIHEKNMRSE